MASTKARFLRTVRLVLAFLWLGMSGAPAAPVTIPTLSEPTDVTAGWKMHAGDDPAWTAPDFDDSGWSEANIAEALGRRDTVGYIWFRKEIFLPKTGSNGPAPDGPAIQLGWIEYASAQVFANGQAVGNVGEFPPNSAPPTARPMVFHIPANQIDRTGILRLAVRVWRDPAYARRAAYYSARHDAFQNRFAFGLAATLTDRIEIDHRRKLIDEVNRLVLACLFVLVSHYHFMIYLGRRQLTDYLWFGISCTLFAVNTITNTTWALEIASPFVVDTVKVVSRHLAGFTTTVFIFYFLGRPLRTWIKALLGIQLLFVALIVVWPELVVTPFNQAIFATIVPMMLVLTVVILRDAAAGNIDARPFAMGFCIVFVVECFEVARSFGLVRLPLLGHWSLGVLVLSMAVAISNRFHRVYRELDSLNQELEAKVATRTEELAKTNDELAETVSQLKEAQAQTALKNEALDRKIAELKEKNDELTLSQQQANRIFSALAEALPGTILDEKYRLDERIGEGGFGIVFRGTHLMLGRAIAVKVFKPRPGNDNADAVERFKREGISISRLTHPNVVSVLDSGISTQGIAYMVMELLEGRSLAEELKLRVTVTLQECIDLIVPVCDALAEAHRLGIIHRDIKPDNIFLNRTPDGEVVKVVDFGIAKMVADTSSGEDFRKLTATESLIGTPAYMSPERLSAKPFDGRSDVYSVGVILFELLTGRPPFESDFAGLLGLMLGHIYDPPPDVRDLTPTVPESIAAIVAQTLGKTADERPTARELAARLAELGATLPPEVRLAPLARTRPTTDMLTTAEGAVGLPRTDPRTPAEPEKTTHTDPPSLGRPTPPEEEPTLEV